MPSVADSILTAVKTVVEAAFAARALKCHVRRASEKNPTHWPGTALPCFVVSANEDRPTRMAWSGKKFVEYTVTLEYLSTELPGQRAADSQIEETLKTVAALFLKPSLAGAPEVNDCNVRPRGPYQFPFRSGTALSSAVVLTFETIEPVN